MKREGIRPPRFVKNFAYLDWDAEPMPVISLFPIPENVPPLEEMNLQFMGVNCLPQSVSWTECAKELKFVRERQPLICSIFNWDQEVEWGGVKLRDFLDYVELDTQPTNDPLKEGGYFAFYSHDGNYFESLPRSIARDPRTMLVTEMNGKPLSLHHGGPLRLVVPTLQGYKSVKWLNQIRAFKADPAGIKRLLAQSKTGRLGRAWKEKWDIAIPDGMEEIL
jgi:DMSO/TMAO reductase YedYZ molybdopterin-dependent catalytic subunit